MNHAATDFDNINKEKNRLPCMNHEATDFDNKNNKRPGCDDFLTSEMSLQSFS